MQGVPGMGPVLAAGYGPGSFLKNAPGGSQDTAKAEMRSDDEAGPVSSQNINNSPLQRYMSLGILR